MTHYLRTLTSTEATPYETEDAAISQVQANIANQKAAGRDISREGEQIVFRETSGALFNAMWIEDEEGNRIHIPME